jgi:hypothetical protein
MASMAAQRRVAHLLWRAVDPQGAETKGLCRYAQTLGEHLKKQRRELGLLQREASGRMGVSTATVVN